MSLLTLFLFVVGLVLLIAGAEVLVRGASRLATSIGISQLVIGLTIVSFGTSAPELATNIQSSLTGHADIAIGSVVGSNIANILLILGLSAVLGPLLVSPQLLRFDVPLLIGFSFLVFFLSQDGTIGRLDGAILFVSVVIYTTWLIFQGRKDGQPAPSNAEGSREGSTEPPARKRFGPFPQTWIVDVVLIVVGGAMLTVGANWLVDGAVAMARLFGITELVIGLTIVAVGTSLPELATSAVASLRGHRDIAVGNVIGSNSFNLMSVLGLTSLIAPGGIPISEVALQTDMPIMITVVLLCFPLLFTGRLVERWEGGLLFGYYLTYITYLLLRGADHAALPLFAVLMFVVIVITFVIVLVQAGYELAARARKTGSSLQ
ncbi:MAG: calcium/sodium antiporter [Chloroflexaceae bacterium]|nr:calcium/sodium antiporter [Chloroflexaceae bacterium]